jgi:hypothetical protein
MAALRALAGVLVDARYVLSVTPVDDLEPRPRTGVVAGFAAGGRAICALLCAAVALLGGGGIAVGFGANPKPLNASQGGRSPDIAGMQVLCAAPNQGHHALFCMPNRSSCVLVVPAMARHRR